MGSRRQNRRRAVLIAAIYVLWLGYLCTVFPAGFNLTWWIGVAAMLALSQAVRLFACRHDRID